MAGITLVSLNIERSKHIDRVIPFLQSVKPEVVCLQELNESDIARFKEELSMDVAFAPFGIHPKEHGPADTEGVTGVGIFGNGIAASEKKYYRGSEDGARVTLDHLFRHLALLSCDIPFGKEVYRFVTTHFTWAANGGTNDEQQRDLPRMCAGLDALDEFVLCGDFNAPRGGEVFTRIAERYTDNIPAEYTTSIDGAFHRAGQLPYMVDGLFSTPAYEVSDVYLQDGVSDHKAIVARIGKRPEGH